MQLTASQHKAIAIFLFLALTVFLRLGSGEIQPWDEGLNAMRARAVLENHSLAEQKGINNEKLNSVDYAPLTVYTIAGSMKVFGKTLFAVRFFTALCSALALFFFYLISRRLLSYNGSIIAMFLLSGSMAWNTYARLGMSEIQTAAFLLGALFFTLKVMESVENKKLILHSLGFGISFTAALLTKQFVILLPIIFFTFIIFEKEKRKQNLYMAIALASSLAIVILCNLYLASKSGYSFLSAFIPSEFNSPDTDNTYLSGMFYYFGQLILSNPFCIFTFFYIIFYIFKRKILMSRINKHGNYLHNVLITWFVLTFIILTAFYPGIPQSSVYMLPPALLLAMKFLGEIDLIVKNNRLIWLLFSILVVLFLWTYIYALRVDLMEIILRGMPSTAVIIFISIAALLLMATILIPKKYLDKLSNEALSKAVIIIPYLLILKIIFLNLTIPTGESFGAVKTSEFLKAFPKNEFIYLHHGNNKLDGLNPQLDWYTDGWLSGWLPGKSFLPVRLKGNDTDFNILRELDDYPGLFIVYYLTSDKTISDIVIKNISETRTIVKKNFNYIIFGRKKVERIKDSTV